MMEIPKVLFKSQLYFLNFFLKTFHCSLKKLLQFRGNETFSKKKPRKPSYFWKTPLAEYKKLQLWMDINNNIGTKTSSN